MPLDYFHEKRIIEKPAGNRDGSGCLIGAIAVPAILLILAIISKDFGGPCIWPAAVIFGGIGGFAVGRTMDVVALYRWKKQRRKT
jgi:hypothetical protein